MKSAITALERRLRCEPLDSEAARQLAREYRRAGRDAAALRCLEAVLERGSDDAEACYELYCGCRDSAWTLNGRGVDEWVEDLAKPERAIDWCPVLRLGFRALPPLFRLLRIGQDGTRRRVLIALRFMSENRDLRLALPHLGDSLDDPVDEHRALAYEAIEAILGRPLEYLVTRAAAGRRTLWQRGA